MLSSTRMLKVEAESQSAREFGTRCLLALLEKYEGVRDLQTLWIEIRQTQNQVRTQKAPQAHLRSGPCWHPCGTDCKEISGHSCFSMLKQLLLLNASLSLSQT